MATEELQRLVLRVDANINRYERQLNKMERQARTSTRGVERQFDRMGRNINRAGMRFAGQFTAAIAAVAAPAALARASMATLQYAQDLESASDRIGFSIERLQEYRFAADQNGIATRALDMGLQRFSRRVAEAAQGTGELLGTLEQYNIQLRNTDGSMRDINDIFRDYADAIQGADNQSEALRLAFKAFDSEGAALVEFLRGGSDALDTFGARAREAGVVLEEGLVRQGAEAQRTIDELKASVGADFNRAVLENAEGLERLAEALGSVAEFAVRAGAGLGDVFRLFQQINTWDEPVSAQEQALRDNRIEALTLRASIDRKQNAIDNPATWDFRREQLEEEVEALEAQIQSLDDQYERMLQRRAQEEARREQSRRAAQDPETDTPTGGAGGDTSTPATGAEAGVVPRMAPRHTRDAREREARREMLEEEAERKRELELEIARDAADAYLDALEQNREKFVRMFSQTMTDGVRAAFEGNLPEYAARRMQEAFYDRLSQLFERLAGIIFDRGNQKGSPAGDLLSVLAGGVFGGGRSIGGNVNPGMAYTVGENGPETLVMGGARGTIIPSDKSMPGVGFGGTSTIRLVVDEGAMFEARVVEVAGPLAEQATITAVATSRNDLDRQSERQLRRLR